MSLKACEGESDKTYHDEIEELRLFELAHEFLIPGEDVVCAALVFLILTGRGVGVLNLVLSVLLNEQQDLFGDRGEGDGAVSTKVLMRKEDRES